MPLVAVRVISLSDYSIDIKAYLWAADISNAFSMSYDLLKSVKQRFDKECIEIPISSQNNCLQKDLIEDEKNSK